MVLKLRENTGVVAQAKPAPGLLLAHKCLRMKVADFSVVRR
jgi:hypothetical protein